MYDLFMRSRWFIAIFMVVTIGSIAAYVGDRRSDDALSVSRPSGVEIAEGEPAYEADAQPAATRPGEDPLIDKTIGEDVRPEEEKAAEAAALAAAAAAQARMQPVMAEGGEGVGEGE